MDGDEVSGARQKPGARGRVSKGALIGCVRHYHMSILELTPLPVTPLLD